MRLTDDQKAQAIDLAAKGEGLGVVRDAIGLTPKQFRDARDSDPLFAQAFARAQIDGIDELTDKLPKIHEAIPDVNKARLYSDNVKWLASKRKPEVYGDRLDLTVAGSIDLVGILKDVNERRARLLPGCDQIGVAPTPAIDITPNNNDTITGVGSVNASNSDVDDIFK